MTTSRRTHWLLSLSLSIGLAGSSALAETPGATQVKQDNWPRFRGPTGTGEVHGTVPTEWIEKSVVWRTALPGSGHSSPIVWGDRIFLTTAIDDGRERAVLAVDAASGKVLWQQTAWKGNPEPTHKMNGWATPSCTTDGTHVWAFFGVAGVHCYTVEGKHVWSQDLGTFKTKNARGTAASPVLFGDVLAVNGDSETDPYLFGLDKATGKILWKTERAKDEGFSTPVAVTVNGKVELVLNGPDYIAGYNPADGKELWRCKSFAGRGEPLPAIGKDGTLYVVNGLAGDVYAVKPGGSGNVTKTHMAWHTSRKDGRDEPSPVCVGNILLVSNMQGRVTGYDMATGKELWKQKIIEKGQITSAPIVVGNKAYFPFEAGETVVVEPSAEGLTVVSRNTVNSQVGELFRASPAVVGGKVYIRSDKAIYCVK